MLGPIALSQQILSPCVQHPVQEGAEVPWVLLAAQHQPVSQTIRTLGKHHHHARNTLAGKHQEKLALKGVSHNPVHEFQEHQALRLPSSLQTKAM